MPGLLWAWILPAQCIEQGLRPHGYVAHRMGDLDTDCSEARQLDLAEDLALNQ